MHDALTMIPAQMDMIYTQALQGIRRRDKSIAREIFLLLLCNPLGCYTSEVMDYAGRDDSAGRLSFHDLREICTSPLIQVCLHHSSVQGFLLRRKKGDVELIRLFTFSEREAHEHVALTCLERLSHGKTGPFLYYAAKKLIFHCIGACEESSADLTVSTVPQRLIDEFGSCDKAAYLRWRDSSDERAHEHPTPLHAALNHRCPELALSMLESGAELFDSGSRHGTPLHITAKMHYTAVVHVLLDLGANKCRVRPFRDRNLCRM